MKLCDIKLLETKKTFSPKDFPLIINNISDYYINWFEKSLNTLNDAISSNELTATEFKNIKDGINRATENAHTKFIREPYYHAGKWENIPRELDFIDNLSPELHRVISSLKKLEKIKSSKEQLAKDKIAFFKQLRSLAEAVDTLKNKIVKKKKSVINKEQEAKKKTASIMSHKDVKKVQKVLTDITKQVREDVLNSNIAWLNTIVTQYKNQYNATDRDTNYMRKYARDPFTRGIIGKVVIHSRVDGQQTESIKKQYKKILNAEAKRMTNDILDTFINKNTTKMGEILKNKNNLATIKLINADASRGIIQGLMKFVFKDKSSFEVVNKIVSSYSKHGTPFYRFPTTFHKVQLVDGSKMSSPSEKKMKELFK